MATPVSTTVTELPESRVRVQAEVPAAEVEKRVAGAARALGRNMRVPGFRKGKVPPPVIIQRVGREAVLDEAVRESIAGWYSAAIDAASDRRRSASPTSTSATCPPRASRCASRSRSASARRPTLGEYKGLEVGRREPEVADEAIDARDRAAARAHRPSSRPSSAPPRRATSWSWTSSARIDGEPFERRRGPRPDGRARLRPPRPRLRGPARRRLRRRGARRSRSTFPDDYGAEDLAGQEAEFAVTVKEVKAKELPRARRRPRRRGRLRHARRAARGHPRAPRRGRGRARSRPSSARRRSTPPSAPRRSTCPSALVEARARELWDQMAPLALAPGHLARGLPAASPDKTEEEIVGRGPRADAERALRREAVLAAVVEAEGIEASDDEVMEVARARRRRRGRLSPKKLLERLRSSGRLDTLKADLAQRKAIDLHRRVRQADPSSRPGRDKLDPEQDRRRAAGRRRVPAEPVWTPGELGYRQLSRRRRAGIERRSETKRGP